MKNKHPLTTLLLLLAITFSLWAFSKEESLASTPTLILLSQLASLFGVILVSISFFLSTRARFLEKYFGGLDKLYSAHKNVGSLSFILLIFHPISLYINALPDYSFAKIYTLPSPSLAYNLGIYALYLMIFSFVFIVFVRLPYNLWKMSHRLLGVSFLLGGVHAMIIGSDIARFLPLRIWMFGFISLGLFSFFYIVFLYAKLGPRYEIEVVKTNKKLDVLDLYLRVNRTFKHKPGQFIYLAFNKNGIAKEFHPFSLSSSPFENLIRLSIKAVGDYTLALGKIRKGDKGVLYGPYGSFAQSPKEMDKKISIWIAGGIGVTPFLGMLRDEFVKKSSKQIHFYYCVQDENDAHYHDEISGLVDKLRNIKYVLWCSSQKQRITAMDVLKNFPDVHRVQVLLCGPKTMMTSLKDQMLKLGMETGNIRFEDFELV